MVAVNPYFNSPQLAQAAQNIASMFAPPSSADEVNYATAKAKRQQSDIVASMTAQAGGNFDQLGMAGGLWTPNQSIYAVDTAADVDRRGQDVTAQTSRSNNTADNTRALGIAGMQDATNRRGQDVTAQTDLQQTRLKGMFDLAGNPLTHGEAIPGISPEMAEAMGVPAMGPTSGAAIGAPADPMTDDQVIGAIMGDKARTDPAYADALARNGMDTTNIVGDDGKPRLAYSGAAAAQGAEPYINPGSIAAADLLSYIAPDGSEGSAVFDPNTQTLVDASTKQPLPQGVRTYKIEGGDKAAATGATTSTQSRVQQRAMALQQAKGTLDALRAEIQVSPASQGLVGSLRGTAQDVMQTGTEMGRFFGGTTAEVADAVNRGLLDANVASEMFDPSIPAIQMMQNALAFQYAKSMAGDRVSNEQLNMARRAIGGAGAFANEASSLASLDALDQLFAREAQMLGPMLPDDMRAPFGQAFGTAPAAAGAPAIQPGHVEDGYRFIGGDPADPNAWEPVR